MAAAVQTHLGGGHHQVFREAGWPGEGVGVGGEGIAWLAITGSHLAWPPVRSHCKCLDLRSLA